MPVPFRPPHQPLVTLLTNSNQSSLLYGSDITIYTNGTDKFHDLLQEIAKATHHIHIQYYIFCDDEVGNKVKKLLIEKAKEGVEVRVLYDDVGCWNVKDKFFKEMSDAGIEVHAFLKVAFPVFTSKVNYRNHRKIVVIDAKSVYGWHEHCRPLHERDQLGDMERHALQDHRKGSTRLTSRIPYRLVCGQQETPERKDLLSAASGLFDDNIMQICTSGPVGQWRTLLQAAIFTVANAKKYVFIQTPYFLPTEGLNQALQIAALGGVDVRLMLPKRSDTRTANMATHSFIDEMVKAGVKVYFYKPGFLHSKLMVADDELTCIGSANMDFRSFEHNFEINAFVYQPSFAQQMRKVFLHDMHSCERLVPSRWLKRPLKQRIAESFMRLFSPLL